MRYNPSTSALAGVSATTLQQWLAQAQAAYAALMSGSKVESLSYTQGNGSKSVTYTRTNMAGLLVWIQQLQAQLGIVPRPRRALRPYF
jgi:hypothetical protein